MTINLTAIKVSDTIARHAAGMSRSALVLAALASLSFFQFTSVWAAGNAEAGAQKAYTCLGCHGVMHYVNTYPTYHVPKLGGQHEAYLIAALKAYRGGQRSHATMQANAALLTDQDIADIAAYFADQR